MIVAALTLAFAVLLAPSRIRARTRALVSAVDGPDLPSARGSDDHAVAATFDLLAACLGAGMPTADAARAVAAVAPLPLSEHLRRGADRVRLGADPATAWATDESESPLASFARAAERSSRSGAPLAGFLSELAVAMRADADDRAAAAIERAGVSVSGPLGLCFLPAFVCLGIVPVVVGLAGDVLGGGLL